MVSIRTYEGWWDVSLSNPRNERALLSAAVAAIVVWATAFMLAIIWARGPIARISWPWRTARRAGGFELPVRACARGQLSVRQR